MRHIQHVKSGSNYLTLVWGVDEVADISDNIEVDYTETLYYQNDDNFFVLDVTIKLPSELDQRRFTVNFSPETNKYCLRGLCHGAPIFFCGAAAPPTKKEIFGADLIAILREHGGTGFQLCETNRNLIKNIVYNRWNLF